MCAQRGCAAPRLCAQRADLHRRLLVRKFTIKASWGILGSAETDRRPAGAQTGAERSRGQLAELLIAAENIVTAAPTPTPAPITTSPPAAADETPGIPVSPGYVLVEDGWITAVGEAEPPRAPDEYLDHGVLVPGFVDLQVNGYYGAEFDAVDEADWR